MIQQIDAPLREDVRLLGNLLGETLKEHAGQDLFNQVEQIRALSKGARDGQVEAEKQLEQLFFSSKCTPPTTTECSGVFQLNRKQCVECTVSQCFRCR
jgi:phosphoenolpyruvate carboxylase